MNEPTLEDKIRTLAEETIALNERHPDAAEIQAGLGQVGTWLKALSYCEKTYDHGSIIVGYYLALVTLRMVMARLAVDEYSQLVLSSDMIYALQQAAAQIHQHGELQALTDEQLTVELEIYKRTGQA